MDFTIYCDGNRAYADSQKVISAKTVGLTAGFDFSEEWEGLNKTILFKSYTQVIAKTIVEDTDEVTIPADLLIYDGCKVWIGVCGADSAGTTVIPTLWALIGTVSGGADPADADNVTTPTPTLESQIMDMVRAAQLAASAAASASGAEILSFYISDGSGEFDSGHLIERRTDPADETIYTDTDLGTVALIDEVTEEEIAALIAGTALTTSAYVSGRRLSDYHASTDAYCLKDSDVANNLTTETAGKVLDAMQGKILKALIEAEAANRGTAITAAVNGFKKITYGTDEMTAGSSYLETGAIYFQYE